MASWNVYLVWWDDDTDETTRVERIPADTEHEAKEIVDGIRNAINSGLPRFAVRSANAMGFTAYPLDGFRYVEAHPADSRHTDGYSRTIEEIQQVREMKRRVAKARLTNEARG